MTESMRMWVEISFNITYLLVVWGLVVAMWRRRSLLAPNEQTLGKLFTWAFGLLALGDTGHVGFRVWAYARGGLDTTIRLPGTSVGLVGLGALSTAITVTLFYVLVLLIWQRRFGKPVGWFGALLLSAAVVRGILMVFPQNDWNSSVPPWGWSIVRNIPLLIQGLGVATLILRDAVRARDRTFKWIGAMIVVSYGFYLPVILFVQRVPMLGMLMIPKTIAYVAVAWLAFNRLFGKEVSRMQVPVSAE